MNRRTLQCLVAGAALFGSPAVAAAETPTGAWRYTDERGVVHFTDNLATVPSRHRQVSERLDIQAPAPAPPASTAVAGSGGDAMGSNDGPLSPMAARIAATAGADGGISPEDLEKLEVWMNTWGVAYLASGVPWGAVTIAVGFHALLRRRWLWALGAVGLWPIGTPLYLLMRFDSVRMPARAAMLAAWTLPFIVGGLALRQVALMFSA